MKNTLLASIIICMLAFSPNAFAQLSGQGQIVSQQFELDEFQSIGLGVNAIVYLTQGNRQSVEVEGQQNIIQALKQEVKRGSWNIEFGERVQDYDKLVIHISMPTVESLSIGGGGEIETRGPFEGLENLDFSIGGSGAISFAGDAKNLQISIGGSGRVEAVDLVVSSCEVSIGGSGNASVAVRDNLNVSIAGSGDVVYKGSPRISSSIAGGGQVKSL